jgi:predicted transcriptional regulator
MDEDEIPGHRSKCRIIADILSALQKMERPKITYLIHEANLSYSRTMDYLKKMEKSGLIEVRTCGTEVWYDITEKGRRYLVEFKKFLEFSDIFGVEI